MSFSGYPAKAKSNGRCGGLYIPFAPPATPLHSSHSSSFRSIAYTRTEHICNYDGIANILRSAASGNVLPSSSQAPYRSPRRERQVSFTPLLLLSPQNLRFCGGPRWQPLSAVSGRKRYNTLDFAVQNRVPTDRCSHLLDDPEPTGTALWNPIFFEIGAQTQPAVWDRSQRKQKQASVFIAINTALLLL